MVEARSKIMHIPTPREPKGFTAIFLKHGVREFVSLDNQRSKPTAGSVMELVEAACGMDCKLLEIRAHDDTVLWVRVSSLDKDTKGSWKSVARGSGYIRG